MDLDLYIPPSFELCPPTNLVTLLNYQNSGMDLDLHIPPSFELCPPTNLVTLLNYQNIVDFLACIVTLGRYAAEIRHSGEKSRVHLGTFDTVEELARVYDAAARKFHGAKAKLSFPEIKKGNCNQSSSNATTVESSTRDDSAGILPDIYTSESTGSCVLEPLDGMLSSCADERINVCTTNYRDLHGSALRRPFNEDIYIHESSPQPVAFPNAAEILDGKIVKLDSFEQKPLVVFDATNNRAHHSSVLVFNSEKKGTREELNREGLSESALSSDDSTEPNLVGQEQSSSTASHFNKKKPRKRDTAPIKGKKRERDTSVGKGINWNISEQDLRQHVGCRSRKDAADILGVSVSTLKRICRRYGIKRWRNRIGSAEQQSFDATNNRSHHVKADQSGPTLYNSEKENMREAIKGECVANSVLSCENLQQQFGGRSKDAAKGHGDSLGWKSFKVLETLLLRELSSGIRHLVSRFSWRRLMLKRCVQLKTSRDLPRTRQMNCSEGLTGQKWATIEVYSSEGQRPLKVISLCTGWKLVSRLQLINVSWRGSPWFSAIPGGGEIVGLALSSSGFAATNDRANLVGQNPSGSTASHSDKKKQRDVAVGKGINFAISEQDLRQHFGRTREEAAKCLGVSVTTFKRLCRRHGIMRWPNRIRRRVYKPPDPNESKASCPYDGAFHQEDQIEVSSAYPNCNDLECAQPQVASKEMVTENTVSSYLASRVEAQLEGDGFGTEPTCFDTALSQLMSTIPETGPTIPEIMPPLIAGQDRVPVTMKAIYRDSMIKFQLPLSSGLTELNKEVAMRLALEPGTFDVEYKDDDGDWIMITCDKDLRDYLQLFSSSVNPVPKLLVLDKVVNANESSGSFKRKRP